MEDWQTFTALGIVAATACIFIWRIARRRSPGGSCGASCGCERGSSGGVKRHEVIEKIIRDRT